MKKSSLLMVAMVISLPTMTGCLPDISLEMIQEMRPQRPEELEKLNMFVGEWTTATEMTILGLDDVIRGTGTNSAQWDIGGWFLTETGEYEMGPLGTMHVLGVWTWEPGRKRYRTWWFDDMGVNGSGTATVCKCCGKNWTIKAGSKSPWGPTVSRGTVKFIDDKTLEWTWKEWSGFDLLRVFPLTRITGTSTRK